VERLRGLGARGGSDLPQRAVRLLRPGASQRRAVRGAASRPIRRSDLAASLPDRDEGTPAEAGRLARHRTQALDYWRDAADPELGVEAPRFVVLCAFRRLEIWEPGRFPKAPRGTLELSELPEQYDALQFLAGDEPVFTGGQAALTREAVEHVTEIYHRLGERQAAAPDVLRDFLLQSVWSMFAEDLGQIPGHRFTRIVDALLAQGGRSSADDLGGLYTILNDPRRPRPEHGLYAGVPFANGGLFERPAHVHLDREELGLLRVACGFNWREVDPQIFGSLLEKGLGHDTQWQLGAHYTHAADIQKVVQPTIVRPWRERIENLTTHAEAVAAHDDLMRYVVLDPACGSGNFLYVAYRELRRLEDRLREREDELRERAGLRGRPQASLAFFPLQNICGIELNAFAVALARVTLWMGHKLAVEELDLAEATLPLEDLSGIRAGDALRMPWPRADAIVGNPPFHGSQNIRRELGDAYAGCCRRPSAWALKDYCVYWFRRAHQHLEPGDRAGLVGTNSISQNRARGVSLDFIAKNGGTLRDAVSKQKWPGEAVVNVSIVNWVKEPEVAPERFMLDGAEVEGINTRLEASADALVTSTRLEANRGWAFQGPIPAGCLYLSKEEAGELLERDDAPYADVLRPYLIGDDVTDDPDQAPRRYVIDFDVRSLEQAMEYPAALELVRERVKPERDRNRDRGFREKWWRFGRPRGAMRAVIAPLSRYIAGNRIGKRFLFCWCQPWTCPSDLTNVFAFEDDYAMGILSSSAHLAWAKGESSTLRVDLRYTPTSAFETFPWPEPSAAEREAVANLTRRMYARRSEICVNHQIGLTTLYNQVDAGAFTDLRDLHRSLDETVAVAYGWPRPTAHDAADSNARLLALNEEIAAGRRPYAPFPASEAVAG